jgi:hypothetical protein
MIEAVRLKKGIASPDWSFSQGDIAKVGDKIDEKEALRWIEAGIAELVTGEMDQNGPEKPKKAEDEAPVSEQEQQDQGNPAEPPQPSVKKPPQRRKAGK